MQLIIRYILITLFFYTSSLVCAQFVVKETSLDSITEIKEKKPIEANFLFSYYEQDGTKSPVTGGIGNEALKDRVANISLKIPINHKVEVDFSGGVDVYTSASTDNIDNEHGLYTETSASYQDARINGALGTTIINEKHQLTYGLGIGISHEYDVNSMNINASFSKALKNRNTRLYLKGNAYNDKWKLIYPSELRWKYHTNKDEIDENPDDENEAGEGGSKTRNSYNGMFSIEQDISPRITASLTIETTYQTGLLSTPFHRVYFFDSNTHDIEKLPNNRIKIPLGIRLNYYVSKFLVARFFYRYYYDDFGINAHTASIELPVKPIRSLAIAPFYRYHNQTASVYFKPFGFHSVYDEYYTSDFDLGDIESNRLGVELRFSPFIKNKDGNKKRLVFKKVFLRGSKYYRLRKEELILKSYIVALGLNFRIE